MIADLRFIERDGKRTLQMKRAELTGDASGAVCGHITGEWEDVPFIAEQKEPTYDK